MRNILSIAAAVAMIIAQAACSDASNPTQPSVSASRQSATASASGGGERRVNILDACDSTTFNPVVGAGTCIRPGRVTFDKFIAQLTANGVARAWRFVPPDVNAKVGNTLVAFNHGGEVHTFTEVKHFGGGIVPLLNHLSGNDVIAPECSALKPTDFIAPGDSHSETLQDEGTEFYQCCIHPWMRATVHIHSHA